MTEQTQGPDEEQHRAGLFDIRFIIAALIGSYGLILVVVAFFTTQADKAKADGLNINLYAGIGMVVVAALFLLWVRLRPIVVPAQPEGADDEAAASSDRPAGG